jgi:hypothetical protein
MGVGVALCLAAGTRVAVGVGVPVALCLAAGTRVAVGVGVPVAAGRAVDGTLVAVLVPDGGTVAVPLNKPEVAGAGVPVAPPLPVGRAVDGSLVAVLVPDGGTVAVPATRPDVDGAGTVVDTGDEMPADGEKIDGTDEDGPPVQAETDAETRMVAVAQPAAVSLALLTFMRPPCAPGRRRL